MDAAEFEGLFYNNLSENIFKIQIINIKTGKTIGIYLIIYLIILEWTFEKQWHVFPVIKIRTQIY